MGLVGLIGVSNIDIVGLICVSYIDIVGLMGLPGRVGGLCPTLRRSPEAR
jgi:hypothetical protein